MPAEWSEHERTWMAWPCRREVWGNRLQATKQNFADVAHAIRRFEPVTMVVNPADMIEACTMLGSDIELLALEIDDSWMRDIGPTFVINDRGDIAGVDFRFNAWGNKYAPFDKDDAVAGRILELLGMPQITSSLTAEGGGLCVDGEATLLTTRSCLQNANRNPEWCEAAIAAELSRVLGASKTIWLPGNVAETETDGHIDGIAMFVKPGVVLLETVPNPDDPAAQIVRDNLRALDGQTDANGRPIEVVLIEEAYDAVGRGDKFCKSYVNFYFVNGGLILPCYGIPADDKVHDVMASLFPEREIVQLRIDDIAVGGGGIHCITQQQPMRQKRVGQF